MGSGGGRGHLDSVLLLIEQLHSSDMTENRVSGVTLHIVCDDGREVGTLQGMHLYLPPHTHTHTHTHTCAE